VVKQKSQSSILDPSPSHSHSTCPSDEVALLGGVEVINDDKEPDTGDPTLWDPHVGMKPLQLNGCASDGELKLEDEVPYASAK